MLCLSQFLPSHPMYHGPLSSCLSRPFGYFLPVFNVPLQAVGEYSADCMRWALADAGDSMDDANFETTTANAAILRLTKELAWIDEVLAPGAGGLVSSWPLSGFFTLIRSSP